jgi:hypothetical protein
MANFAVIENGVVTNVIIANDLPTAIAVTGKFCVEYEHEVGALGRDWTYKEGIFAPPVSELITPADPIVIPNAPKEINSPNA